MPRSSITFRNLAALGLPAAYLVLEFSFNHRLMTLTADMVDEQVLQGLEYWGRLLSGIGFGLLLFRMTRGPLGLRRGTTRALLLRLSACLLLGVVLMWNLQKWITAHWVSTASEDDKKAAWVLGALAGAAAQGTLMTLRGDALLQGTPSVAEGQITAALFPAASLYVDERATQLAVWTASQRTHVVPAQPNLSALPTKPVMPVAWTPPAAMPVAQLDNGFRNLIIPPLTLGFSLFFGLVNLAQLVVNLLPGMQEAARRWAATGLLVMLVAVSATHVSPFLDSAGYQGSMQGNLWTGDASLAVLTEWSFRAVALWQPVSTWLHEHVLQSFAFRKPY